MPEKSGNKMKHEEKYCPRCKNAFECKAGSIMLCQCMEVRLDDEERSYISSHYEDCLCAQCMRELKSEFHRRKFQDKLKSILGVFYREPGK